MKKYCIHCYVSGRTQGVWFRSATQKKAIELNISGWVKNLDDGRVEVLACGDSKQLSQFEKWLWKGPILANVKNVLCEETNEESDEQFIVIRD